MIFESMENAYEVIRLYDHHNGFDNYLCRAGGEKYILCCIWEESLKLSCCTLLLEIMQKGIFNGIVEVFCSDMYLIAVFRENPLQQSLKDYLEDSDEYDLFRNRMEFVYQILCGLCINDIPVEIACDLFLSGNIGIRSDSGADGYYNLLYVERFREFDMVFFCRILADQMQKLFRFEIEKKPYKELKEYVQKLREGKYVDFLSVVSAYTAIYRLFQEKYENGTMRPDHRMKALMQQAVSAFGALKKVFVLVLIIAALGFLVWSLRDQKKHTGGIYAEIGEVRIREYQGNDQ